MFRSNRDIEVYLREWRDLAERSQTEALCALDTGNLILLEQYVRRGYVYRQQRRHFELLMEQLPAQDQSIREWRSLLEERLYGKTLTIDTVKRRKEYEQVLDHLERQRIVLLQEVDRRRKEVMESWRELGQRILFTRELGERMTWLRDACDAMDAALDRSRFDKKNRVESISEDKRGVTAEVPYQWTRHMTDMNQILMKLSYYAALEVKECEEVLRLSLLFDVLDHSTGCRWFLENGFREEEIPSVEEWEEAGLEDSCYQRLLSSELVKQIHTERLLAMEKDDPSLWPEDPSDPFWKKTMWGKLKAIDTTDEDEPLPLKKRGPRLVLTNKDV